jgi:hypothetical protein
MKIDNRHIEQNPRHRGTKPLTLKRLTELDPRIVRFLAHAAICRDTELR